MTATAAKATPTAAQLAADLAAAAVPAMISAVKHAKHIGMALLGLCLLVTFPHTGEALSAVPHVGFFGWIMAAIQDAGLMSLAHIVQTPGLHPTARKRAITVLSGLGAGALVIQATGPGTTGGKALFIGAVALGLALKWVIAAVEPDFEAMQEREQAATAQAAALAPVKPAGRKCPAGCGCGKHRKPAAKPATRKAATARKRPALEISAEVVELDPRMQATLDQITRLDTTGARQRNN